MKTIISLLLILLSISCYSQDSTNISYYRLGEFAKYVTYKDSTENIFTAYRNELKIKDSIIQIKEFKINYKDSTINTLNKINVNNLGIITSKDSQLEISDLMYKQQRGKKWRWGFVGIVFGTILGIVLASSI